MKSKENQLKKFQDAAREAGADMTKDEFGRVIGGLAKPKPPTPAEGALPDTRIEKDRK